MDEEKIKWQAKLIMDEFVNALGKVGEISGEAGIEREQATRTAKKGKPDNDFKERMLKNAPRKEGNHLVAERKSW